MFRFPDGRLIAPDVPFTMGEGAELIQYPANWLRHNPDWAASKGIQWENPPPEPEPAVTKQQLRDRAADARYAVETGGCVWNGHVVHTDRESQGKLTAQLLAITANMRPNPASWKFKDGFASLSNADMSSVIEAVYAHVASAYRIEETLIADINADKITSFDQINSANWPSNG